MNPAFLDEMSWEMAEVYGAITDQILINLARHFPFFVADTVPRSAFAYQAKMLAQMGQVNAETMRIIRNGLADAGPALRNVLEQSVMDAVRVAEPDLFKAVKRGIFNPPTIPVVTPNMTRAFNLYYQQAADKLNLVNTVMLESTKSAYQKTVTNVVAEYELAERLNRTQIALDVATGETITGVESWNNALRHATDRLKDGGIVGFIDHAGRQWSAEAYVAMDIRTTVFNTGRAAVWETNQSFGNDLYSVSYHNGARPKCYPYQNRVISSTDNARTVADLDGNPIEVLAQSDTSYGEAAGLFGINCKHYPTPFIPGVSVIEGTPQNKEDNERAYAESQHQRSLERKIREEKRDLMMAKARGDSEEEIARLREKTRQTSQEIDDFCKETGRQRRRNREGVYTKRDFPDADRYDVTQFEHEQQQLINQYFGNGGAQQGYTFGQLTPNEPIVPTTPTVPNVAQQATQTPPVVVQSQAGTSVLDAQDMAALRKHMQDNYGITVDSTIDSLDFSTVREALSGFESVANEVPEVRKSIKTVTTSTQGVMSCNGTKITFNPHYYKDPKVLQATIDRCVASHWWPANTSAASIGAHETAHGIEWVLIEKSGKYGTRFEQVDAWNKCTEAKLIRSDAAKAVKKTPFGKGKVNKELFESISGYAAKTPSETMAEAFADVYANGENASPMSKAIHEFTMNTYEAYKAKGVP